MKISTQVNCINIKNALNAPKISKYKIENINKIFEIINKKIKRLNEKNKQNINSYEYIQKLALRKLETLRNLDCEKNRKIKRIFNYIHWYYIIISLIFNKEWLKISIPDIFRQIIENPSIINNFDIIICWDNPWVKEYNEDRWFNPNANAGSILKILLNANSIKDENVLFFNKTFISTKMTNDLKQITNKKLVKSTIEFNSKILNLLSEILKKPVLILWWQNETIFKLFFKSISNIFHLAPHTSMYKIFWNNKNIIWWNEKFEAFKLKYQNIDIFSNWWYVSLKKIKVLNENKKNKILIDYFNNVVLW